MKVTFYIANKDGSYEGMEGYLLPHDIVAHRSPADGIGWRLSDYNSGMMIKPGLRSLKECKEAVETMPDFMLKSICEIRESDRYKKKCSELRQYVKDLYKKK